MQIVLGIAIGVVVSLIIALFLVARKKSTMPQSNESLRLLTERLEDLASLNTKVDGMALAQDNLRNNLISFETAIKGVETKVVESTVSVKDSVLRDFGEARRTLEGIKTNLDAQKHLERELQESSRRIESVIAGGRSRGRAGENILAEAFKQFPPNIIETNYRVNGHIVEYALILADGKRVPIDSKWAAVELIAQLESENDAETREKIAGQIEQTVSSKVKEVSKYIDPSCTTTWGIAAIPDAAFNVCRNTHLDAFSEGVVLMPFSLALVYLLSLYQLHLQYARSVDIEKLNGYLTQMDQSLEKLDNELENKISRGSTMVSNAFNECKRQIGVMRGASAYLRNLPEAGEVSPLELIPASNSEYEVSADQTT